MKWLLIVFLWSNPVDHLEIGMPSQEVCEQIKDLNPGSQCWIQVGHNATIRN